MNLERDQARLLETLQQSGFDVPVASSADGELDRSHAFVSRAHKVDASRSRSPRWQDFGSRSEDEPEAVRLFPLSQVTYILMNQGPSRQTARRASIQFPSSLASSTASNVPPLSSDSATFKDSFTPTTSNGNYPFDSPSNHLTTNALQNGSKLGVQPPPLARMLSGSTMMPSSSSPTNGTNGLSLSSNTTKAQLQPSPSSLPADPSPAAQSQTSGPSDQEKSKAKDAANNAAKSFRVTLEDPCWKVLPAALKKYKINDDWKMYALFICFGNTGKLNKSRGITAY